MSTPRKPRVLVTGGGGFLGSHLCERLVAEGAHVTCLDNFCTGAPENVAHLRRERNFQLIEHDITRPIHLSVEQIYNLACPASPDQYQKRPIETTKANVYGVVNMLELASAAGATLLQASTSEVYGDSAITPQHEAYAGVVNPIGPRACYDEGKRCAESLCFDYHREHGVHIKVARIFNTYGPRMHSGDGRVVSNFICRALRNEPLVIYGDGEQTRSFCYVDDLISGLVRLMNSPKKLCGPVNLGNPEEVTVRELCELVIGLVGSRSGIERVGARPDDPRQRRPDIGLARRELSWEPRIDLHTGLLKTIEHFATQPVLGREKRREAPRSIEGELTVT